MSMLVDVPPSVDCYIPSNSAAGCYCSFFAVDRAGLIVDCDPVMPRQQWDECVVVADHPTCDANT